MLSVSANTTRKIADSVRLVRVGPWPPSRSCRRDAPTSEAANTTHSSKLPPTSAVNIVMFRKGALCSRSLSSWTTAVWAHWYSVGAPRTSPIARTPPGSSQAVIASGIRRIVTDQSAPARESIASQATPNTPRPSAKKAPIR